MIRRIFSIVIFAAVLSSCGNSGKKDVASKEEGSGNAAKIEFAALVENPDNYVGKNVIVEGKVVHVCTVSGKKLFIVGTNPDIRLFIAAGENMPKFPLELLGSEVTVEGVITRTGGAAEMAPKAEHTGMMAEGTAKPMSGDSCETETALAKQSSLANIIMDYKSHTVK
jgi:ribosomal protein S8E